MPLWDVCRNFGAQEFNKREATPITGVVVRLISPPTLCRTAQKGLPRGGVAFTAVVLVLFGYLPLCVAIALPIASAYCAIRSGRLSQLLIAISLLAPMAWSSRVLLRMLEGAWPTLLPHLIIGAGAAVVVWQIAVLRRDTTAKSSATL